MNFNKLSKIVSHALRHDPKLYNLNISKEGWVQLQELVTSIQSQYKEFNSLNTEHIHFIINRAKKKRHEINGDKIRALYGHSIDILISNNAQTPPQILYHGTSLESFQLIKEQGLIANKRQYVHLTESIEEAQIVARRKSTEIIILMIFAEDANADGIRFYQQGNVWLTLEIPPQYLQVKF